MNIDDVLSAAKEIINKQTYCFAITVAENQDANARLVQATKVRDDWSVRFFTERRCRKFREIERSRRLTLAYQHDPDRAYATLVGHPKIIEDVETKTAMWGAESHKIHLGGPDDPNLVIVELVVERIEIYSGVRNIAPPPRGLSVAVLTRDSSGWRYSAT
jgi:general stress protein 26